MRFTLEYLGEVLDEFDTRTEAVTEKWKLVVKIMEDQIPEFLTHDDFENDHDCADQLHIIDHKETR